MEVQLKLKTWKVDTDAKTGVAELVGVYAVVAGSKEIAEQKFNGGYGEKPIQFSETTMTKLKELEADIKAELHAILS